ncbi:MAG: phosphatase PAP2 family protein [Lactobacillaceae bacterium]|jgi:lipid A 4'-phosphatase|nr:phosphatase PAP2 family protein [Lactobacillaceae bacterium]
MISFKNFRFRKIKPITFFDEKPIVNLLVLFFSFMVIALSPYLDIFISGAFFKDGNFLFKNNIIFNFVDKYFPHILVLISLSVFLLWLAGYFNSKKWIFYINTKAMWFLCGTMLIGPLIIVNGLFKTFWGRARPKDIIEFGGDKIFSPAMIISDQCRWDCSFVSGHTSVAFWLIALALVMPEKHRKAYVWAAFVIGVFVAFVRIAQGYHFFSDVFFAGVVTTYVIWIMYYYLKPN